MHANCPLINMPILLHRFYASFIEWVVNMIDAFLRYKFSLRVCHKNRFAIGSKPEEGSSKYSTSGFPIKASATESYLRFPPLRCLAYI